LPPPRRRRSCGGPSLGGSHRKHTLTPTIFFFVGFNLILWTKRLILQEHGVEFSGFFTATVAALLVGKAVLVTDNLPLMHRFDGAPMIQPILFKSAIYWLCVLIVRLVEVVHFVAAGGTITDFPDYLVVHFSTVPLALVRGEAYPPSAHSPAHSSQPIY
jgi:hypothetical protein